MLVESAGVVLENAAGDTFEFGSDQFGSCPVVIPAQHYLVMCGPSASGATGLAKMCSYDGFSCTSWGAEAGCGLGFQVGASETLRLYVKATGDTLDYAGDHCCSNDLVRAWARQPDGDVHGSFEMVHSRTPLRPNEPPETNDDDTAFLEPVIWFLTMLAQFWSDLAWALLGGGRTAGYRVTTAPP